MILFLIILPNYTYSQNSELGVFYGASYYLGDLNPSKHFAMPRVAYGGMFRYNFDKHISMRLNGFYGSVEANDKVIGYNKNRNLHFRSSISELSLQFEINFLPFFPGEPASNYTPYIFGGLGGFMFNPKAEADDGEWHELQPLGTEGQYSDQYPDRKPYDLYAMSYIFGIGYKFFISKHFTVTLEWGMRRTTTDYLDDVSTNYPDPSVFENNDLAENLSDRRKTDGPPNMQRGDPHRKDWYSFAGFIIAFKIPDWRDDGCPTSPYN